jgi:hypothetical protein
MATRDPLQNFPSAKSDLLQHQQELLNRLAEIDTALASGPRGGTRRSYGPRPDNEMSLAEAIAKVMAKSPLSVRHIVEAVGKAGYKFSSANPINSVGAHLYGLA